MPAILLGLICLLGSPQAVAADRQPSRSAAEQAALEARIQELISQLGAAEYSTRERALAELDRIGLEAFDALNEACLSDDIEIALQARYLVRSMQVTWVRDTDPADVKQILRDYGEKTPDERRLLMQQLAELDLAQCLRPLCRLLRYESSQRLSRRAALLVMQRQPGATDPTGAELAAQLRRAVGLSKRSASEWLRLYARTLEQGPDSLVAWTELIAQEEQLLAESPEETSRELIRDLLWWYADQRQEAGHQEQALAALRKSITLLEGSRQQLLDAVEHFKQRKTWTLIVATAAEFPAAFQRTPLLMYRLASAYAHLGQHEQADRTAAEARKAVPDEPREHVIMAYNLQHDGMFRWAELEYRHVIEQQDEEPLEAVRAQIFLSEMLHDTGAHKQAGQVLLELVQAIESDQSVRKAVESQLGRDAGSIKSRLNYFLARHQAKAGNVAGQREYLAKAFASDPVDADVLIAMYRLPDADDQWKQQTRQRIQAAVRQFQQRIAELQKRFDLNRREQRELTKRPLATACNQLAWLVANTEGDFQEALRCSQQSVRLFPEVAGYHDTLGRCYYALGDYDQAIASQRRAVTLEPNSPQLQTQLALFQQAKEAAETAAPDTEEQPH